MFGSCEILRLFCLENDKRKENKKRKQIIRLCLFLKNIREKLKRRKI